MKRLRFWKSIFNKAAVNTGIAEPQFEADFEEITWLMVVSQGSMCRIMMHTDISSTHTYNNVYIYI